MNMSDRIKSRRLQMGLTQEELATKLGLQKSAIAKYENGRVENIKRSIIQQMADVLECSPAYLMGWDDQEDKADDCLQTQDQAERDLLVLYRNGDLSDDEKAEVVDLFKSTLDVYYKAKGIKKSE